MFLHLQPFEKAFILVLSQEYDAGKKAENSAQVLSQVSSGFHLTASQLYRFETCP